MHDELCGLINKTKANLVNQILLELKEHYQTGQQAILHENKKIKRFSKKIIDVLEQSFARDKYPNEEEKQRIANLCLISLKQVNNWFTNKRNRTKHHNDGIYR